MNFFKIFFYNLIIFFSFILILELIFGYWFDKDNFGPYMREHRMKNQRIEWTDGKEKITYFYRKNYYGFRGADIKPSKIDAIIMGGSVIDERYKPEQYTIAGYLNEKLNQDYNITLVNAGIEAQSTQGMLFGFKNWLSKLKNFSPKFILFYVGLNDVGGKENFDKKILDPNGHIINPSAKEALIDNIKSRSILYDSARIFKFKYLPRKGFIKYDGKVAETYKRDFKFIDYNFAKENYDIKKLQKKYYKKIKNYIYRIDKLYERSKKIGSEAIYITNITSAGHTEELYILNFELIKQCKLKKYKCIDMAKNINGKIEYWKDGSHTTKKGSETFANEIYVDLKKILSKSN